MLNTYLTELQNLLGIASNSNLYTQAQLVSYINEARGQVALDGQCVRVLSPIQGSVTAITIVSGGTGWSNINPPIVSISAPDSPSGFLPFPNGNQAFATCLVSGGAVTSVTVSSGGAGYFQPQVTFTSGAGQGTVATVTTSLLNSTSQGQEVYPFSAVNPTVATSGSGVLQIIAVNSVNIIWGTFGYVLGVNSFTKYQALVRTYRAAGAYQFIPAIAAQYGQGSSGSLYMYPVANEPYQMEWDCFCQPQPLNTDTDAEAIPQPWQDVVKYYAAYLAFLGKQRFADARTMFNDDQKNPGLYQIHMARARRQATPRMITNWYGR